MDIREEVINRMLRILEHFARRFKIAICLPLLLEQEKFRNIFGVKNVDYKKLYKLCMFTHQNDHQSSTELTIVPYSGDNSKSELEWAVVLENLSIYENQILSLIDEEFEGIPQELKNIINNINLLKEIVEWQMRLTPKQIRERKLTLRNAEIRIAKIIEETKKLKLSYQEETSKHEEIIEKSKEEIHSLALIIEKVRKKHSEELHCDMSCHESKSCIMRDEIKEEEGNLYQQLQAYEEMLGKLRQANLEQEKILREKCIKAENKNLKERNLYDQNLSKLHELKETLELQLQVTTNHCDNLKNEYEIQNVLYINLKKERELALMQAFAERLDRFEKNRAARIIQRTWRAYHERISAKKKKKSRRNK